MKILKIMISSIILSTLVISAANADAAKGQKYYKKKIKNRCGISGAEMAGKHTEEEWSEIGIKGLLKEQEKLCPKKEEIKLKEKYKKHILDFYKEYSSDSGNVPSC